MNVNLVKRILSLILTVALLLGNIPAVAFATEEITDEAMIESTVATEPVQEPTAPAEPLAPTAAPTECATEPVPTETSAPTQPEIATPTEPIIPTEGVPESVPVETSEPTQQETVPEETVAPTEVVIEQPVVDGVVSPAETEDILIEVSEVESNHALMTAITGNYTYTIVTDDTGTQTVTITAYSGSETEVALPDNIEGFPVTKIGAGAFAGNTMLQSVVIPSGVTEIEDGSNYNSGAFYNCSALTNVSLPETLIHLGAYTFYWCTTLTEIALPDSLEVLGEYAFYNCTSLQNISFGEQLNRIGNYAFYRCEYLRNISLPISLKEIGEYAFYSCSGITEIFLPQGLEKIGSSAFAKTAITILELPDSVVAVDLRGMEDNLTYLRWTAGIPEIGKNQFRYMNKLETIVLPEGVTTIADGENDWWSDGWNSHLDEYGAFRNCSSLKNVILPDTLTYLGAYAFEGCSMLENIVMGKNVEVIGSNCFANCPNLKEIPWSENLKVISSYAFDGCTFPEIVELPASVTTIDDYAFYNHTEIKEIVLPASLKTIGYGAFSGCSSITEIHLSEGLETLENAFSGTGITKLELPDSVTSVDFNGIRSQLQYIRWTAGIPEIKRNQFESMASLETVILPEGVTTIADGENDTWSDGWNTHLDKYGAFRFDAALKTVVLPSTLTRIGDYAFEGCTSLEIITIGENVTEIGSRCFAGCTNLKEILWNEKLQNIDSGAFTNCPSLEKLVLPDSVITIKNDAFQNCTGIKEVTLPSLLKTIEYGAFNNCGNITEILLPEGLETLDNAFSGTGITKLELPDSVTSVDISGLQSQLQYIRWTAGIPIVPNTKFQNFSSLKTVVLPEGVTEIQNGGTYIAGSSLVEYGAFRNCYSLESILLPNSLTTIGNRAFQDCTNLSYVRLGRNTSSIHSAAFLGCPELTLAVWSGTWGEQYAIDNGFEFVYAQSNGAVKITLNPESYKGMQLVLLSDGIRRSQQVSQQDTYTFSSLDDGALCTLQIKNAYGDVVHQIDNISVYGTTEVTLEDLTAVGNIHICLLDEQGNDVTAAASVDWFTAEKTHYASGTTLINLPIGKELHASIRLNEKYGKRYYFPEDILHTVKTGTSNITITLELLPVVHISGTVTAGNRPLSGATIVVSQTINGKFENHITVVTDKTGLFETEIPAVDARISISAYGYMPWNKELAAPAEAVDMGSISLENITGAVVHVNAVLQENALPGEDTVKQTLTSLEGLEISAYNQTQAAWVDYIWVQGTALTLTDHAAAGDTLEIIIADNEGTFQCCTSVVTLDEKNTALWAPVLIQAGSIQTIFQKTENEDVQLLIYNNAGNLVLSEAVKLPQTTMEAGPLEDGSYTVVLMGKTNFLEKPQTLAGFAAVGLTEGIDYVQQTVSVTAGTITACKFGAIPLLNESQFYFTDPAATSYTTSKTSITAGKFFTLRATAPFAQEYAGLVSNVKWIFEIPDGTEYYEGTLSVGSSRDVVYKCTDGLLTVQTEDPSKTVRFCVNAIGQGTIVSAAWLEFTYDGKVICQPVGSVTVKMDALDFSVTEKTFDPAITISGTAASDAEIRIYDNEVLVAQTKAVSSGHWTLTFDLYNPGTYSKHQIYAVMDLHTGTQVRSKTHQVIYQYSPVPVSVSRVSMYSGNSADPLAVFDFKNPKDRSMSYSVLGSTTMTFLAEFECEDLSRLSDVKLEVEQSDGSSRTLDMLYNEEQKGFVTSASFGINAMPMNVGVSYVCDQELAFSQEHMSEIKREANDIGELLSESDNVTNQDDYYQPIVIEIKSDIELPEELVTAIEAHNQLLEQYWTAEQKFLDVQKEVFGEITATDNSISSTGGLVDASFSKTTLSEFSLTEKLEEGYSIYRIGNSGDEFILIRAISDDSGTVEQTVIDTSKDGQGYAKFARTPMSSNLLLKDSEISAAPPQTGTAYISKAKYNGPVMSASPEPIVLTLEDLATAAQATGIANSVMAPSFEIVEEALEKFGDAVWDYYQQLSKDWRDAPIGSAQEAKLKARMDDAYADYQYVCEKAGLADTASKFFDKAGAAVGGVFDAIDLKNDAYLYGQLDFLADQTNDPNVIEARRQILGKMCVTALSFTGSALAVTGAFAAVTFGAPIGAVAGFVLSVGGGIIIPWLMSMRIDENVKKVSQKYNGLNAGGQYIPPATPLVDPSGYIYEAVPSNRLEGVTVTCYEKVTKYDQFDEPYAEIQLWDAEAAEQQNPLTTDTLGQYAWDVPAGWWQVKAELTGYETTYSEWLPVPPPQLEVNLGMVSYAVPEIADVYAQTNYVEVEFSKYLYAEDLIQDNISVFVDGASITGTLELLDAEASPAAPDQLLASKIRFVPIAEMEEGAIVTVCVDSNVCSYADVPVAEGESAEATVVAVPDTLFTVKSMELVYKGTGTITIQAKPAASAAGKTVYVKNSSDLMLSVQEESVVLDEQGCAIVHLTGKLPGESELTFLFEETKLQTTTTVQIRMPESDEILTDVESLTLTQSYIALEAGESVALQWKVRPRSVADKILWTVEAGGEKVIAVDADGNITGLRTGTAYVIASVSGREKTLTARCRVDVTENVQVNGVQLSTNKVTTELYKDEFATFEILLDLPQNHPFEGNELMVTDDAAMAAYGLKNKSNLIKSVQFKNINNLFTLELLDDRTVQIVPTEKAMKEGVKGTPSDTVVVTLRNGQILETTEKLSLTVKKTLPKLKATIASFNSFYEGQTLPIVITGADITGISKNEKVAQPIPTWLTLEDGCLKLNGNTPKASDKAYLLVDVDGWVDPVELTLTVKHAKKVPGIKLAATTVTVADRNASTEVELKLQCSSKTDVLKDLNITGITAPKGYTVENFKAEDGTFTLKKEGGFTSGKITLTVAYGSATKNLTLNVKTQAVKLKLSSSKVSLNKELPDQAVVEVICATENYNFDLKDAVLTYDGKMLDIVTVGNALIIKLKDGAEHGKTYPVSISAYQNAPAVKLSVAVLKKGSVVKSTIKATGTLDVIREGTAITVKSSYTNYLNVNVDEDAVLKIYSSKDNFKKAIAEVYAESGIFTIDSSIIGNHTLKYKAQLETKIPGKTDPIKSNQISLSVKMGAAKLTAKSSGTTMFAKDRNDRALVWFEAADATLNDVASVKIKDAKYKDVFEIIDYRDGSFAIAFKDGKLHESIAKQLEKKSSVSITLSLDVFMEGNESAKANTTQKVKLTIVK